MDKRKIFFGFFLLFMIFFISNQFFNFPNKYFDELKYKNSKNSTNIVKNVNKNFYDVKNISDEIVIFDGMKFLPGAEITSYYVTNNIKLEDGLEVKKSNLNEHNYMNENSFNLSCGIYQEGLNISSGEYNLYPSSNSNIISMANVKVKNNNITESNSTNLEEGIKKIKVPKDSQIFICSLEEKVIDENNGAIDYKITPEKIKLEKVK